MRVMITGGAGFFGSRAALYFPEDELHLVDREGQDWTRVTQLGVHGTQHAVNLLDPVATRAVMAAVRPNVLIHLAWYAVPVRYLTAPENFEHAYAATQIFRAAAEVGCSRFCGAGTCLEYESSSAPLREDAPTRPDSVYGASKLATYLMLERAAASAGVSFAWLRFFYPYGPLEANGRLVSSVISEIAAGRCARITPGEQSRDFIHVDDVARAISTVARASVQGVVNVGTGTVVKIRDVVAEIARLAGRPDLIDVGALPYREGDPPIIQSDISRLRSLGFAPKHDIFSGLADSYAWVTGNATARAARA